MTEASRTSINHATQNHATSRGSHPSANRWVDVAEAKPLASVCWSDLKPLETDKLTALENCVRLDWEELPCFSPLDRQFEQFGVVFANAVVLRPSNLAYPAYSGVMVAVGAPRSGWLEATFLRPVKFVSGFVTSSRRTILTGFNAQKQAIIQSEMPPNLVDSSNPPNTKLSIEASQIYRITLHTFDGQFTLDDFCFSF